MFMRHVHANTLKQYCGLLFENAGMPAEEADIVSAGPGELQTAVKDGKLRVLAVLDKMDPAAISRLEAAPYKEFLKKYEADIKKTLGW